MDTLFDTPPAGVTKAKTIRILVYPNITYAKDLTKDSYVIYLTNAIRQLNRLRDAIANTCAGDACTFQRHRHPETSVEVR